MRIAMSTPRRMTGSPQRAMSRVRAAERLRSLTVAVSLPVTTRPQLAALTKSDRPPPTCDFQSPVEILSRISASRVAVSGILSNASARHISATPSWLESEYSCTSPSTPEPVCFARRRVISLRAVSLISRRMVSGSDALSSNGLRHSGSGRQYAAVIACRNGPCGRMGGAKSSKGVLLESASERSWGWLGIGFFRKGV